MRSFQKIIESSIGEFGRSQVIIMLASTAPKLIIAWSMIMMSFAGAQPKWWIFRSIVNITSNTSVFQKLEKTCPQNSNETIYFDTSIHTIISEWNLVCYRDWIPTVITTAQMVGVLVGAAITGQLGDWFGRKRLLFVGYGMDLFVTGIQGLSINWQMMTACVFILGCSMGGFLVLCNVYMMEFIGTKWRTFAGCMPFWGIGVALFGLMFKLFPNWRHLCFSTTIVGLPFLILLWFAPRSVRWLLVHGHTEEAKGVLQALAKRNKLNKPDFPELNQELQNQLVQENAGHRLNYFSLFKLKSTRLKTLILIFSWFTCSFAYYGLTLGVGQLAGDISLNMFLMGVTEAFTMGLVWLLSKCLGRKNTTVLLFILSAVFSFGITIAYHTTRTNFQVITNFLALISRFFLSATWGSLIILTTESYPTVIRGCGYGCASVVGRIGGILAPQNITLSKLSVHLPFTVNGGLTICSGVLCLLLTDTYTSDMDDHIKEDVQRESKSSSCHKNVSEEENTTSATLTLKETHHV